MVKNSTGVGVAVGSLFQDTIAAIDPDRDRISFDLLGAPDSVRQMDSLISWSPTVYDTGVARFMVTIPESLPFLFW